MTAKWEANFQITVIEMAHLYGWRVAHFRPGMNQRGQWLTAVSGDGKGFPDLFCVRPKTGHRLAAELKVGKNEKTPEQDAWLTWLAMCGIPAYTWHPTEWEEIERVLKDGPEEIEGSQS